MARHGCYHCPENMARQCELDFGLDGVPPCAKTAEVLGGQVVCGYCGVKLNCAEGKLNGTKMVRRCGCYNGPLYKLKRRRHMINKFLLWIRNHKESACISCVNKCSTVGSGLYNPQQPYGCNGLGINAVLPQHHTTPLCAINQARNNRPGVKGTKK